MKLSIFPHTFRHTHLRIPPCASLRVPLRAPLRLLFLLVAVLAAGAAEAWAQDAAAEEHEYYYKFKEVYGTEVFRSIQGDVDNVWFTSFSVPPTGMTYSVTNGKDTIANDVLVYYQGGGSGDRAINTAFIDSKFQTDKNWVLEFEWGAESGNQNASYVKFATNNGEAFTITWAANASSATITDASGTNLTTSLPIDGYAKTYDVKKFSHFKIEGDKDNGIYLTVVADNGETSVNRALVSSTFGYPATFNGDLGRAESYMALDSIYFNNDASIINTKVPFRKYNVLNQKLYSRAGYGNGEYNETIALPMANREMKLEYQEATTKDGASIGNVVFLTEAEDIEGLTECSGNTGIRSSNSSSAYAAAGNVEFTKLKAGTYKLTAAIYNATSSQALWTFYANEEIIAMLNPPTGPYNEATSSAFVIEEDDIPISLGQGGSKDRGVDLIYIQRIGDAFPILKWAKADGTVVKSVTVDISEMNDDNLNNAAGDLPTQLLNTAGKNIAGFKYASSDESVARFDGNQLHIIGVGSTVISVTDPNNTYSENVDVASYTLDVTGAKPVRGDYDKEMNTYSFNKPGQTFNTAEIAIEGITMTYGDAGATAVVVKNETIGPLLKVIDANGYSHPNLTWGQVVDQIPAAGASGGTYYVFKPTIDGKLTVTGNLSNATMYEYGGSGTPVDLTQGNAGTTMTVSLTKGKTYYLYNGRVNGNDNPTPLLHSFRYEPKYSVRLDYDGKINVDGTPTIDGFAFNNNVTLRPKLQVFDASGRSVSGYSVRYTIDGQSSSDGVVTTSPSDADGKTITIEATVSVDGETTTAKFALMVIKGEWLFSEYKTLYHDQLKTKGKNDGIYDNDPDVWEESSSNTYVKARETPEFEYMLRAVDTNGENENEPIDIARTLQSRASVRWMRQDPGFFYMFGYNNVKSGASMLKVPVQKDMIIEIKGYSNSEYVPMLINNDGNPSHTDTAKYAAVSEFDYTSVTNFYINKAANIYRFIVTNPSADGFLYIINPASALPFSINHIKLSNEILFKYGTETYISASETSFYNEILNATGSKFKYELVSGNGSISNDPEDKEGTVKFDGRPDGTYEIKVTGTEGPLKGVTGIYKLHVVNMEVVVVQELVSRTADDDLEWSAADLKSLVSITKGASHKRMEDGDGSVDSDPSLLNEVVFSESKREGYQRPNSIRKVLFRGEVGNQSLIIEGTGKVELEARLGNIVCYITFEITGAALLDRSPVYADTETEARIVVTGDVELLTGAKGDDDEIKWMLDNLIGELADHRNIGKSDELQLKKVSGRNELILSRKDGAPLGHGGALPITLKCKYGNDETRMLEGMLTIAYSNHSWKFDHNMLEYDHEIYDGVYNFYTDKRGSEKSQWKRNGKWTEYATFDEPVDAPQKEVPKENRKWKYIRKMGSENPQTDILYAYLGSVDGDNAKILPESAGLLINSEKESDQFGVMMSTTRFPVAGQEFGLPNMVASGESKDVDDVTVSIKNDFYQWTYDKEHLENGPIKIAFETDSRFNVALQEGDVLVGPAEPNYEIFADLTTTIKILFTGTNETALRVYLNKKKGSTGHENEGEVEEKIVTIADGEGELDLSGYEYVQLNAIKVDKPGTITSMKLVKPSELCYDLQNIMLRVGGELIIPYVQPGQWIEMRWTRHNPDMGERMRMKNLCDVEGTLITENYLIGNTTHGTYMFQVDPTLKEDRVHAEIDIIDNVYISIQEVILHEPGWEYKSSMSELVLDDNSPVGYQHILDGVMSSCSLCESKSHVFKLGNRHAQNAPNAPGDWQIECLGPLTYDLKADPATNHLNAPRPGYIADDSNKDAKVPTERPTITVKDGWGKLYVTLNSYTTDYLYVANRKTWIITFGEAPMQAYPYTWDFTKYFADTKRGVGNRKVGVTESDYYDDIHVEDPLYDELKNTTGSHEYRVQLNTWDEGGNEETMVTADYNTEKYGSFFVDGAQLVSYGLWDGKVDGKEDAEENAGEAKDGRLPETAGLGFRLKNLDDTNNDNVGILKLDMQSRIGEGTESDGMDGTTIDDGRALRDGASWRAGKLAIRGGGSIIVPRPRPKAAASASTEESTLKPEDYYIYIMCSVKPSDVKNATEVTTGNKDCDVNGADGQYKYRFKSDEEIGDKTDDKDVEIKFDGDADVYVVAVTDMFKQMTALSGTGWATESRDRAIDHSLTGYLTTNATMAYAVIEDEENGNPLYSDSKAQTVVSLRDRHYVVPKEYGIVMKQTEVVLAADNTTSDNSEGGSKADDTNNTNDTNSTNDANDANGANNAKANGAVTQGTDNKYQVPLFVPAVTTTEDDLEDEGFNLMRPNVAAREFREEGEVIADKTLGAEDTDYTRFILASRYMTWKRQDGELDRPTQYETREAAAFYRLHVYDEADVARMPEYESLTDERTEKVKELNTLPANTAYLLLRTSKLNPALWSEEAWNSQTRAFVGIEGESDMPWEDDATPGAIESATRGSGLYNLSGQRLRAGGTLAPGIYIKDGKKFMVR